MGGGGRAGHGSSPCSATLSGSRQLCQSSLRVPSPVYSDAKLPFGPPVRRTTTQSAAVASSTKSSSPSACSEHWNRAATGGWMVTASIMAGVNCASAGARSSVWLSSRNIAAASMMWSVLMIRLPQQIVCPLCFRRYYVRPDRLALPSAEWVRAPGGSRGAEPTPRQPRPGTREGMAPAGRLNAGSSAPRA